ncbi:MULTISPECIES: hypothetical protein [unclassified Bradyrhizobium]|uniref:hypothetical protein n=1 Tax=unclassified Bradyrhizobium TaxID=2631580 RepID=UPI002916252A|nr:MULTISPECIES: hypothetical protein [unclassified Bradyrhizobium]
MSWSRHFDSPITLPDGRKLVTLRDAGEYIRGLSESEQAKDYWQAAAQALLLVVESKTGPTMLAHIGMMQALNHEKPRPKKARLKKAKPARIIR